MSQIIKPLTSTGPIPPIIPTEFDTDINSPAIPALNILNVFGGSSTDDNNNGIQTDGSSGSNTLTIQLTNRVHGQVTTSNATPTTIISFPLPSAGVYVFEIKSSAYNITDSLGAGYSLFGTIRSDGANSFLCGTPDKIVNEESGMSAADVNMISGINTMLFQVTGIAGKTIHWCSVGYFCQIA